MDNENYPAISPFKAFSILHDQVQGKIISLDLSNSMVLGMSNAKLHWKRDPAPLP